MTLTTSVRCTAEYVSGPSPSASSGGGSSSGSSGGGPSSFGGSPSNTPSPPASASTAFGESSSLFISSDALAPVPCDGAAVLGAGGGLSLSRALFAAPGAGPSSSSVIGSLSG